MRQYTGTATPVPGTGPAPTMWRDGETVVLPGIPGGRSWQLSTEITGNSVRDTGGTVATVWHCSP